MNKHASKKGFLFNVYQGAQMSLLTMDLEERPQAGTFAGFTLEYAGPNGKRRPLKNLLTFDSSDKVTDSTEAPFQSFKWVHFPGSYSASPLPSGLWTYFATPRYFGPDRRLLPLDSSRTVDVPITVGDFESGGMRIGFTRAFLKSQAFANRFGSNTPLKPKGHWLFDTSLKPIDDKDFTFEDMYIWLGYSSRRLLYETLDEALKDKSVSVEMFAYDLNDPGTADRCLALCQEGRIRIILDNASLHVTAKGAKKTPEDEFTEMFRAKATTGSEVFRCRFGRYSHCKVVVLKKNGHAFRVLTGSTNWAVTGLCVNANHVVLFDREDVATYYSTVFNECWNVGKASAFAKTEFATKTKVFKTDGLPHTEIDFSPHDSDRAKHLLDAISDHVKSSDVKSVLFAVMEMGEASSGSLIPTLRDIHKNDGIYSYGVTDKSSGVISLYKPGRKLGLLIDAKQAKRELPPPFKDEPSLPGHAIHHKFVITNFNRSDGRVYCGSSNLAEGGEKANGDNLICIKDMDVATVFAIEAIRLTDHYNFRSVTEDNIKPKNQTRKVLDNSGNWVNRFFNENDIRCVERKVLAGRD